MSSDWTKNKGGATPGFANSVRRVMQRSEFAPTMIRRNYQYSGWKVVGTGIAATAYVAWRPEDDMPEENVAAARAQWLADYVPVLESAGYLVENSGQSLTVSKKPHEWTPVYKTGTKDLVGYIRPGKFWDLEKDGPLKD